MKNQSTKESTFFKIEYKGVLILSLLIMMITANAKDSWYTIELPANTDKSVTQSFKLQQLHTFLNKLTKKIPLKFRRALLKDKLRIIFSADVNRDALYFPPEAGANAKILVAANLFSHESLNTLLTHEIYHAIHFLSNPDEEAWIREGLAQYFEYIILGVPNGVNITAAFDKISTPLTGNYDIENPDRSLYGHGLLYFYYLIDKCGGQKLFWKLTERGPKGIQQINYTLKKFTKSNSEACKDFQSSYESFELARVINRYLFSASDSNLTYMMPTTQKAQERTNEVKRCELTPFTPFFLSYEAYKASTIDHKDAQIFFINNKYPYDYSTKHPSSPASYSVLLLPSQQNSDVDSCRQ